METLSKINESQTYQGGLPMSAWAEDDIPTNKMLLKGAPSLSNAELISIIIGSGIEGENSLDIAQRLLSLCNNNLCELWKKDFRTLTEIRGIGMKKALQIVAVCHLAHRRNESEVISRDKIKSSKDAFRIFLTAMGDIPYEEFWILMLDKGNRILRKERISEGGISGTVVDPKRIFKVALDNHAASLVLGHNHPSGNLTPSDADQRITRKLVDAGKLLEIAVLDHLIVGQDQYYSFADEGQI